MVHLTGTDKRFAADIGEPPANRPPSRDLERAERFWTPGLGLDVP